MTLPLLRPPALLLALALGLPWAAHAQEPAAQAGSQAQSPAVAPGAAADAPADAQTLFTRDELKTLLQPVALYPDPLLAQMLPAAAYPLEIVQLARWMERNKEAVNKNDFTAVDAFNWDPSVKAMARFPDIVKKMNDDLDWTSDLGDAFVNQPEDVASVIQDLRQAAETTGALKTTPQQKVARTTQGNQQFITIEPSDPEIIYVPAYDPVAVYEPNYAGTAAAGLIGFGTGVVVGSLISSNSWNWRSGWVYPPVWPGYPGWRPGSPLPGYPGYRPGGGNINIGNDINIGGGNNIIGNTKPWRPDPDRYRPGQGSKPGLGQTRPGGGPGTRPGGGGGGIAGTRPGAGGGGIAGTRPGAGGGGIAGTRPGAGGGAVPGGRPGGVGSGAGPQRPATLPGTGTRPGGGPGPRPGVQPGGRPAPKPAARPAPKPARPPSAFGGIDSGRAAAAYGNRGAASRAQMNRPPAAMARPPMHGGAMARPGGMGRAPAARPMPRGGGRRR